MIETVIIALQYSSMVCESTVVVAEKAGTNAFQERCIVVDVVVVVKTAAMA